MSYNEKLTQPFGMIYGGAIFSLVDSSCAVAVWSIIKIKKRFVTAEIKINYLEPVTSGDIVANATILREGRAIPVDV